MGSPALLDVDPAAVAKGVPDNPFRVRHHLTGHPLLTLEALAGLGQSLPDGSIEHNRGSVPVVLPSGDAPREGLAIGELIGGIATNGCWAVLKNIEQSPGYGRLLDQCLDELGAQLGGPDRMTKREGFVFLSAPGSVTPAHIDPEFNVLLQVSGTKLMHIGRFSTAEHAQQWAERSYMGAHRNLDALPQSAQAFPLDAGDGVFVPLLAPHWVENGDAVSISLSITWHTQGCDRAELVHSLNARLRRVGLNPRPPGTSPVSDWAKYVAVRGLHLAAGAARAVERRLRAR